MDKLLQPARLPEIWRCLKQLPSAPTTKFSLGFILTFAVTLLAMVGNSSLFGRSIDHLEDDLFIPLLTLGAVSLVIEQFGRALGRYLIDQQLRRWSVDLRRQCLASALAAPTPVLIELGTGNIITRLTKDIDLAVRIFNAIGVRLIVALLMFPFTLLALLLITPWFLVLFILLGVGLIPTVRRTLKYLPGATNAVSDAEAERNNVLLDTIRGIATLRAFGLQDWALARTQTASWQAVTKIADRTPLYIKIFRDGTFAYLGLVLCSLSLVVVLAQHETISTGAAASAMILVLRMEVPIFNVLYFAGEIQSALTSAGRAVALATLNPTTGGEHPPELDQAPTVTLTDLSFAYPDGGEILNNLSLTFPAQSLTVIVGASGAGKSTVAALIGGLLTPTGGQINIGPYATHQVSESWLSQHVALLTQEVHVFAGSLREDLTMAAPTATDAQLLAALAAVGLSSASPAWQRWFPEGLDTLVGAGAPPLSPEVAQQICLARLWLRKPPVIILDEATSEAGASDLLEQAAAALAQGSTTIMIAHRLEQAKTADQIIVLDAGRVVEQGTHAQLLARGGDYAELWRTATTPFQGT